MNTWHRILLVLSLGLLAIPAFAQDVPASSSSSSLSSSSSSSASSEVHVAKTVNVIMHTALGDIELAIEVERAPITAKNFLRYVDHKRLDGMVFYRDVKVGITGEYGLVQGGLHFHPERLYKPIPHEPTTVTGLSHMNGAISMARLAPGTATAEFFIVVGDLTSLDAQPDAKGDNAGYAVFGHVIKGMDVVKRILDLPCSSRGGDVSMKDQMIINPVKVSSVRRVQ